MAATRRRKVENREEAERLSRELEKVGGDVPSSCRARGVDGRSLNSWRRNLRRVGKAGVKGRGGGGAIRLVEVIPRGRVPPSSPRGPRRGNRLVVGAMTIEVDDAFREDTLVRLFDVVRSR